MNVTYWIRHPLRLLRRVWYRYYEWSHPGAPFLSPGAITFLERALPAEAVGIEWGSGRSTAWLAPRLKRLVSIEHDLAWYRKVSSEIAAAGLQNVDYRLIRLEHPLDSPTRPHYSPMPQYVSVVSEFPDDHFDLLEVDGHYRQACVRSGLCKLKPGGLLLIDDADWIPLGDWGVPPDWQLVHRSKKIDTLTLIWRRPDASR